MNSLSFQQKENKRIAVPAKYLMTKLAEFIFSIIRKSQDPIDNNSTGNENAEKDTT